MLNRVQLIGFVGRDPEIKETSTGSFAKLTLATTEKWKNKQGERQEKTEWHNVVCFIEGLTRVISDHVKKGDKILIEGALRTRKWEKDGENRYTTEVVLNGFDGKMLMLDNKQQGGQASNKPARQRVDIEDDFGAY